MPISGKEMVRKFKKAGWKLVRINGSHHILKKEGLTVTIPVHKNKDLKLGMERVLLKKI